MNPRVTLDDLKPLAQVLGTLALFGSASLLRLAIKKGRPKRLARVLNNIRDEVGEHRMGLALLAQQAQEAGSRRNAKLLTILRSRGDDLADVDAAIGLALAGDVQGMQARLKER